MSEPTTGAATGALVVVAPPDLVTFNLDAFPEARFNRLIPTQTISIPSDLVVPVVQVVQLNANPEGGDVYHSADMPEGYLAPTAVALAKLATAAGISFVDERRLDDGKSPGVFGVAVAAEMVLPTWQRQRAIGSKWIDLDRMSWKSPAQRAKYATFLAEHAATRARNRAIRGLLSLRGSYPAPVIARPFAVVSFAPNMAHPEVRARILDALAPTTTALYGPPPAPLLGAGAILTAPEAPDDDEPAGTLEDSLTGGASAEPTWFAADPAPSAPPAAEAARLAIVLREKAARSGLVGGATVPQKTELQRIFGPMGLAVTAAGLREVFGLGTLGEITAAQAQALIEISRDDTFAMLWRELAGVAAA